MKKFLFFLIFIIPADIGPAEIIDQGNAEYSASIEYKIGRKGTMEYSLESKSDYTIDYKSDSWFIDTCIIIRNPARASIGGLNVRLNGKRIKGGYIFNAPIPEEEIFLDEDRQYVISFPSQLKKGDRLTYNYRQEFDDIAWLPLIFIPNKYHIRLFRVRFEHPPEVNIGFEYFFPHGELPHGIDTSDPKATVLTFNLLEPSANLPYFPFNEIQTAILISISADGIPVNPTTPEAFFGWYSPNLNFAPLVTDVIPEVQRSALDSLSDTLDKLEVLYDYVRNNIRYIADMRDNASIYPHDPAHIFALKYGDCKDHAYLLYALAKKENIPLSLCVINTEYTPEFQGLHGSLYNHMICRYNGESQAVYLDPTSKYLPFGNLPDCLVGKEVLIIDSGGARIEEINLADTGINFTVSIRVGLDSLGWGEAFLTLRGSLAAFALEAQEELSSPKLQKSLADIAAINLNDIGFRDFALEKRTLQSITFSAMADLSKFVIASTERLYIPRCPYSVAAAYLLNRESDTLPIYFHGPAAAALHIELGLPGYKVQNDSVFLDAGVTASYRAVMKMNEEGILELDYDYRRPQAKISGREKEAFMAFYKNYSIAGKAMLIAEVK